MLLRTSDGPAFIDPGNAPEFFANGLHRVEVMGAVTRFVLFIVKRTPAGREILEPPFTCIMPNEAIGPAIALIIKALPSGVIAPGIVAATKHLIFH